MATRMQQRRGTVATWSAADPILAPGEIGFEIDTNKFKIGDGSSRWATLTYFTADAAAALQDLIDGAPGVLDTLNELAAAVNDDPAFFTTVASNLSAHTSSTTNVHGIADTSVLVTVDQLELAIGGASVNQADLAGEGIDWNSSTEAFDIDSTIATKSYTDTAVSTEASDRETAVTAAIATAGSDATTKANAAQSAAIETATTNSATYTNNSLNNVASNLGDIIDNVASNLGDIIDTKAPLASPELTGTPTAPTAAAGTNTTQLATTAFVKAAIQNISDLNLVLDGGGV